MAAAAASTRRMITALHSHRGKNRDNNRLLLGAELVVRLPLAHHDALGQDRGVPSVRVKGGVT